MSQEIDIEFQPNLQRILVTNVKQTTTVDEALDKFSKQAGMVKTSIKRAIPYCPVFSDRRSGQFVPESAPSHMPLRDIFSQEGGLFVVDLEDESLKLLTPSHLKPKKKKKNKKRNRRTVTGNDDSDDHDEPATNPGLIDGSATSALEDAVSTTDFDDMLSDHVQVHDAPSLDNIQLMLAEMQKKMEKEMTDRLEKEAEKTSRLEKRLEKEAEKTSRLEKEMTNRLEKEAEKTNRLEREMEAERNKTSKLEREIKEERKKRSVLEVDVDDLKQSTSDIADWIVAGCHPRNGGEPLRRIQIRNLLDRVQAKLAWLCGLTDDRYSRTGSAVWRESLDGLLLSERLASARSLLQAASEA